MPNRSWGDAFASAAQIQPEDLGDDFLDRTLTPAANRSNQGGSSSMGIHRISEMAQSFQRIHQEAPLQNHDDQNLESLNDVKETSKVVNAETEQSCPPKKKKRKGVKSREGETQTNTKKQKQVQTQAQPKESDDVTESNHNSSNDDTDPIERELEGRLIYDESGTPTMVLVEISTRKVFSGLERDAKGDYVQIGSMDENNEIILFPKTNSEQGEEVVEELSAETISEPNALSKKTETKAPTEPPTFPYPTDSDDHCETPLVAYKHIVPLLEQIQTKFGITSPSNLSIYDPYYCNGSVIRQLASLGYTTVYNKKEDCYQVWEQEEESRKKKLKRKKKNGSSQSSSSLQTPSFDVFLTNPPYSADHIPRLMKYITTSSSFRTENPSSKPECTPKPWLLLMPQWVHKKEYYQKAIQDHYIQPFYLVPKKRYVYEPPQHFRAKKASDTHKKSSPFVSMWYIWGGSKSMNEKLYQCCTRKGSFLSKECDVARSKSALRDLRRNTKSKK